jgi:hypothetical protein
MVQSFSDFDLATIRFDCLIACGFKPCMMLVAGKWLVSTV